MCCLSSRAFLVKKVETWVFHLIDRHPSKKACHPIRFCTRTAFDNFFVLLVGIKWSLPLNCCSLFTIICTIFTGVLLSIEISYRSFIAVSHVSFSTLLLHNRKLLSSSLSLQKGNTPVFPYFHCFPYHRIQRLV